MDSYELIYQSSVSKCHLIEYHHLVKLFRCLKTVVYDFYISYMLVYSVFLLCQSVPFSLDASKLSYYADISLVIFRTIFLSVTS